jgi:hypothetical protein
MTVIRRPRHLPNCKCMIGKKRVPVDNLRRSIEMKSSFGRISHTFDYGSINRKQNIVIGDGLR